MLLSYSDPEELNRKDTSEEEQTALHVAAGSSNLQCIKLLVDVGAGKK